MVGFSDNGYKEDELSRILRLVKKVYNIYGKYRTLYSYFGVLSDLYTTQDKDSKIRFDFDVINSQDNGCNGYIEIGYDTKGKLNTVRVVGPIVCSHEMGDPDIDKTFKIVNRTDLDGHIGKFMYRFKEFKA